MYECQKFHLRRDFFFSYKSLEFAPSLPSELLLPGVSGSLRYISGLDASHCHPCKEPSCLPGGPFCVVPARNLGLLPGSLFSLTPHPISHHENLTNSPPSYRSDHPVLSILTSVTSLSRTTDPHTGFLPSLACSNQHSLSPEWPCWTEQPAHSSASNLQYRRLQIQNKVSIL